MPTGQAFKKTITDKLDSGTDIFWINMTADEGRCERFLEQLFTTNNPPFDVNYWDVVNGATWDSDLKDPMRALYGAAGIPQTYSATIFRDMHLLLNAQQNFNLRRALAELCKGHQLVNSSHAHPLIILADSPSPHPDIKDYCDVIDYDLPTHAEIVEDIFLHTQASLREQVKNAEAAECTDELRDQIVEKLLGLSAEEAGRILDYSIMRAGGINPKVFPVITFEKGKSLAKLNGLKLVPYENIRDESTIAGFDLCLEFVHRCKWTYTQHAQREKIPRPRGIALIGPPGTGKTILGASIAKILGLDLLVLDIGAMYDSLVGSTEKNIRQALAVVSAMPNCVLMVDEIDKAFANAHQNAATDSGVSSRMLSYFLSWLSERDMRTEQGNRTFVVVTMNRTAGLPPELLRAGRFDRIFSTNIPDERERVHHVNIQLQRYHIDPEHYGSALKSLVRATDNYTGAEIEEVIISARHSAFAAKMAQWEVDGRQGDKPSGPQLWPTIDEMLSAATEISPVARVDSEAIAEITKFCAQRTTPVTGHRTKGGGETRASKRIRPHTNDTSAMN